MRVHHHEALVPDGSKLAGDGVILQKAELHLGIIRGIAPAVHRSDDDDCGIGLSNRLPADQRPFLFGCDDIRRTQGLQDIGRSAVLSGDEGIAVDLLAGKPEDNGQLPGRCARYQGDGIGLALLEIGDQGIAAVLDVEDFGEFGDFLIDEVHREQLLAHAVAAVSIDLGDAVGGRDIGVDPKPGELFARADGTLRADMPLEFGRHQIGLRADDGFEARIVVGKAFDLAVGFSILRQDGADPDGGSGDLIRQSQGKQDFGHALADRNDRCRGLFESHLLAAIGDGQWILGCSKARRCKAGQPEGKRQAREKLAHGKSR